MTEIEVSASWVKAGTPYEVARGVGRRWAGCWRWEKERFRKVFTAQSSFPVWPLEETKRGCCVLNVGAGVRRSWLVLEGVRTGLHGRANNFSVTLPKGVVWGLRRGARRGGCGILFGLGFGCLTERLVEQKGTGGNEELRTETAIYRVEHGWFALTVEELDKEMGLPLRISHPYRFQSDGTNWSVVVQKVEYLAGNYLLNMSGEIYFNEDRIPATNDLMLRTRFK